MDSLHSPLIEGVHGCALVGMVHLLPLPGSAKWYTSSTMSEIVSRAVTDAQKLKDGGCDALIVENMGDTPYLRGHVHPETVAAMTVAVAEVMKTGLPVGVQVLAGANKEALGICAATGAQFVRVESFAYSHVADEGWMDASAGELLRARTALHLQDKVKIWADVKKKHAAHAVTHDVDLPTMAQGYAFCGADAVIVSGTQTGASTDVGDVIGARGSGLPVVVGSGVTLADAYMLSCKADGLIVGSWIKRHGQWQNEVDLDRVKQLRVAMAPVHLM